MSSAVSINRTRLHTLDWQNFLMTAEEYGFKCGYTDLFKGHGIEKRYALKENVEEEVVLYHLEKGLIIYAETFGGRKMGTASIYGQFSKQSRNMTVKQRLFFVEHISSMKSSINGMAFEMKVPKNFREFMCRLLNDFEFLSPWKDGIMPYILNYIERADSSIDHSKANMDKFVKCLLEVKRIATEVTD